MLRLHDTALGRVEPFQPREPGKVSMYVCGPTVYGEPHVGHGRFALVFDILRRYLRWSGFEVTYVSNITDVDDKIIARAAEEDRTAAQVASAAETLWWDAIEGLGVERPDAVPHATEYIPQMVRLIQDLMDRKLAYETSDGVYLAAEQIPGYGLLARQSLESLRSGTRAELAEEKRSPVDFALWKKAKPGEPEWESPWGPGRPGWHTECVVMSVDKLGPEFDLHGGGMDLRFPHHENERAQAVGLGLPFSRRWMHNGLVVDEQGRKMSKSEGTTLSLTELLANYDGRAYRMLVLQSGYRSPLRVGEVGLRRAVETLDRLDTFVERTASLPAAEPSAEAVARFVERMDDDLNTPEAMAVVFDQVTEGNRALDAGDPVQASAAAATVRHLTSAVGLELRVRVVDVDAETDALVHARDAARAARDFTRADAIRDQLVAAGWVVEDTPAGTQVRRERP